MPAKASITASKPQETSKEQLPTAAKASPTGEATPTSSAVEDGEDFKEHTGYIAGGTVGGIAFVAIVITGIIFFLRRRRQKNQLRVGGFVR